MTRSECDRADYDRADYDRADYDRADYDRAGYAPRRSTRSARSRVPATRSALASSLR
jgi:hypothetical protein